MDTVDEPIGEPSTTPLERRDIPAQLSETLEHIVGQLDVITQVCPFVLGISLALHGFMRFSVFLYPPTFWGCFS